MLTETVPLVFEVPIAELPVANLTPSRGSPSSLVAQCGVEGLAVGYAVEPPHAGRRSDVRVVVGIQEDVFHGFCGQRVFDGLAPRQVELFLRARILDADWKAGSFGNFADSAR
jgi:hypothetical protein